MTTIDGARTRSIEGTAETAAVPSAARAAPGTTVMLLPTPEELVGDDPGAQIEALVLASARDDASAARQARDEQEALARSAEAAQLDAMKKKVDEECIAGVIGGVATAGAGGIGLGSPGPAGKSWGELVDGGGKLGSAGVSAVAGRHGAEATEQGQLAERLQRSANDARDDLHSARDSADRAVAFFKEYVAARAEAQKAALFRA